MTRKLFAILLTALMAASMLCACAVQPAPASEPAAAAEAAPAAASADVAMQYMTVDELAGVLGQDGYTVVDVRKAADYETSTIPGAIGVDMDAAKEGDMEAGVAAMTAATVGLEDTLVLVCYSGKSYAQASTNALSAIGYDMGKVYTLEGGFKQWGETYPDLVGAPGEAPAPALSGTMKVVATNESYTTLFDKFSEETGVKVELLSMSSGEVLSKLRAEGGIPSADLWFGGGIDAFMSATADGLLAPVDFAAAADIEPAFKDAENHWFSKGLTIVGFLVNNPLLEELGLEAPQSWADLAKEAYKGEVIMSNPAISGTNYAVVNALIQSMGEEAAWDYFEKLNDNIAYYGKRGADPQNKVTADEFAIGISYIDGTIEALLDQYDVRIVYPADGIPWIPDGVAAFANAENQAAAEYFIEWLYSNDENLQLLAGIDQKTSIKIIKPNLTGVELGYDPAILMELDLGRVGAEREAILAQFEALMGDKANVDE